MILELLNFKKLKWSGFVENDTGSKSARIGKE